MGGGLLELVAKGGQDIYLICNPEISFFKKVYKRHTNFSLEQQKFLFDGDLTFGRKANFTVPRQGDLLKNIYLQFELPFLGTGEKYVNYVGYALIDYIEISIGGTVIDRLTGEWMYINNELSIKSGIKGGYRKMVGGVEDFKLYQESTGNTGGIFIVPLSFWFSKDIGFALPLAALQYHEVEITLSLRKFSELFVSSIGIEPKEPKLTNCFINLEYVYLDNKERKLFAQSNHEYLIKQVQYSENNNLIVNQKNIKIPLNFNLPILELIFVVQRKNSFTPGVNSGNDYFYYSKSINPQDTIKNAQILLNNQERTPLMTNKELKYLNVINSHTSIPYDNFIYLYSFSLNPEAFQPSGSCNFSRFDNKELAIEFTDSITASEVKVFAVNYNVLRISMGLGGLAYIN
jgi:hypothetical protein